MLPVFIVLFGFVILVFIIFRYVFPAQHNKQVNVPVTPPAPEPQPVQISVTGVVVPPTLEAVPAEPEPVQAEPAPSLPTMNTDNQPAPEQVEPAVEAAPVVEAAPAPAKKAKKATGAPKKKAAKKK